MGSACRIVVDGPPGLGLRARDIIDDLDGRWSRFRPTSEISGANRGAGRPTTVSRLTYRLAEHALAAQEMTEGTFDPLLLDPLEALGYDRDHQRLETPGPVGEASARTSSKTSSTSSPEAGPGSRIILDPGLSAITIPLDTRFDPGGIGKGLAADIVTHDLTGQGAGWIMVDLGGDLRFGGATIAAHGWEAVIEDPTDPARDLGRLHVKGGAVATSSRLRRRWTHRGVTRHHLLDPTTRLPAYSPAVAATVHARCGWQADILAKSIVIAGPARARRWVDHVGAGAIVSFEHGPPEYLGSIPDLEQPSRVR